MSHRCAATPLAVEHVERAPIVAAWVELKRLDVPRDYVSWLKARTKGKGKTR
jgi:hypothetical protein